MSGYPLLASLAPASSIGEIAPVLALPTEIFARGGGVPMRCPAVWADVAAPECGLAADYPIRVYRAAGLVVVVAPSGALSGLDLRGLRPLPFAQSAVEPLLAYVEPEASAEDMALGLAALLRLAPVLTESEARLTVENERLPQRAPAAFLERWRAPFLEEGTLYFHAGPDPIVEVQAELSEGWLDVEVLCSGWRAGPLLA